MTIFFSLSDFVLCLSLTKYGINHSQVHRSVQCPYCLRQLCLCNYAEKLDAFLLQCPFKRTANELYRGHWHLLLQAQILTFRHIANIKLVGPFFFAFLVWTTQNEFPYFCIQHTLSHQIFCIFFFTILKTEFRI